MNPIRLGVNVDHIATIRNARSGFLPDPIAGAILAKKAGADGITAHLREDRRHITDDDIFRLKHEVDLPLNFEMAATEEMLGIALKVIPNAVCLVPEKRSELTTEGGLDVIGSQSNLVNFIQILKAKKIRVSLFVEADFQQIEMSSKLGADIIEIHTGGFCHKQGLAQKKELTKIKSCARYAKSIGLECHAGHGLDFITARQIAKIPEIVELNIGHFLIGEAIMVGLDKAIKKMKNSIKRPK